MKLVNILNQSKDQIKKRHFWITVGILFTLLLSGCAPKMPHVVEVPAKCPPAKAVKDIEVALVLGIGGFRGLAHLGVIEVLEKEGIPIDIIVGSSAGSIIGAYYADTPNAAQVKTKLLNIKRKHIWNTASLPLSGIKLEEYLAKTLCASNFEQLKIPLVAVATNVDNNELTLLQSGPLVPAIHASSALPHFFKPVKLYDQTLIDGGVMAPVPVKVARTFNPKMVISVNIMAPSVKTKLKKGVFSLLERAINISFYEFACLQSSFADVSIHPNLYDYGPFDDQCNQQVYLKGKEAGLAAIKQIKKEMERRGIKPRYSRGKKNCKTN